MFLNPIRPIFYGEKLMKNPIFAVQFIIEDTNPVKGWRSANHFIGDVEELVINDGDFTVLSVTHKEVQMNEGVEHLSVTPITKHIFTNRGKQ